MSASAIILSLATVGCKEALEDAPNNVTGRISLEDFQNLALIDFQNADADHDGTLTPEEFKTWLAEASVRHQPNK